ncbi:response regulator [Aestuariispira ectoiniformans]|uniref:response regulator n=1 Tax=Aestuariispira ectoiniformans TaxID=2775080 RepID=UPI00223C3B9C|nr:response regulator [Aestuariispira ectoiniformans]
MKNLRGALPPLTSLVVFEAAARQLNFTKASKELLVTREAVSRQIRLLEDFLGTQLFERNGKSLSLTPAGESFSATLSPSIENIARAAQNIIRNPDPESDAGSDTPTAPLPESLPAEGKILVVDDEPLNLTMITELLSDQFEVLTETRGVHALKVAQETPDIDAILLDVQMPEMSGYEICRQLKNHFLTQHIPIIFLTVLDNEEDESQGLEMGASDYVARPFKPSVLKARIRTHVELKKTRQDLEGLLAARADNLRHAKSAVTQAIDILQAVEIAD